MPHGGHWEHRGGIGNNRTGGNIMNFPHKAPHLACLAAIALALALAGPSPALAKQDPGGAAVVDSATMTTACSLSRIGSQLVHCDSLTGAGVSAPSWVPER